MTERLFSIRDWVSTTEGQNMSDTYILRDGKPVRCSAREWGEWMKNKDARRVAYDIVGPVRISTVFLGVGAGYGGGAPVLWETLVFEGPLNGEMERYTSEESARAGHAVMVHRVTLAARTKKGGLEF